MNISDAFEQLVEKLDQHSDVGHGKTLWKMCLESEEKCFWKLKYVQWIHFVYVWERFQSLNLCTGFCFSPGEIFASSNRVSNLVLKSTHFRHTVSRSWSSQNSNWCTYGMWVLQLCAQLITPQSSLHYTIVKNLEFRFQIIYFELSNTFILEYLVEINLFLPLGLNNKICISWKDL